MSRTIWRTSTSALAFAVVLAAAPATATPISGSIMFSDGFASLSASGTAVVSDLLNINVGSSTLAQACTSVFATGGACIPSSGTFASSFVLQSPISAQIVYTYNGFVFTVTNLSGAINRTGLSCGPTTCTDSLSFTGTGSVVGGGTFDPGTFAMSWSATGTCNRAATGASACAPGTLNAFWSATVGAGGTTIAAAAVPEPGTVLLLGVAILAFAFVRRNHLV